MKAYAINGVTPFLIERFVFPDGQPHVRVKIFDCAPVRIETRITNSEDLISLLLLEETLRNAGVSTIYLHITYLLGARMDRRIGVNQPFTLKVIANCLKGHFEKITVLDPHSDVACTLLDAEPVLPLAEVKRTIGMLGNDIALCAPDAGAAKKVEQYAISAGGFQIVQCLKHRDMETGKLSGFQLAHIGKVPKRILICDDICDGGGTFSAVAKLLKENGAEFVALYVTHGIFSNGFEIEGVDRIFTTTSYRDTYPDHITIVNV